MEHETTREALVMDCYEFVLNLFLDTNMVFESQLSVHLIIGDLVPPSLVDKFFPQPSNCRLDVILDQLKKVKVNTHFQRSSTSNNLAPGGILGTFNIFLAAATIKFRLLSVATIRI